MLGARLESPNKDQGQAWRFGFWGPAIRRLQSEAIVPNQVRAVKIAIHCAKNGFSKPIRIAPPLSSSRKMPLSINAPSVLRSVNGPLPRLQTILIDCRGAPFSVMTACNCRRPRSLARFTLDIEWFTSTRTKISPRPVYEMVRAIRSAWLD